MTEAIVIYSTFFLIRVNVILTFKICKNNKPTDLRMDKSKHYSEFNAMVTSRRGFIHINNIPKKKKTKEKKRI